MYQKSNSMNNLLSNLELIGKEYQIDLAMNDLYWYLN